MNQPTFADLDLFYYPTSHRDLFRASLVHGYHMDRRYIVIGSQAKWALDLHMMYDAKHRATLINPHALYDDVRAVFRQYMNDLESDTDMLKRFLTVWSSSPFERPHLSSDWNKFKHLAKI